MLEFQKGKLEVLEFTKNNCAEYLRLIELVFTEESCLFQGYKASDVRGAVGISIAML